MAGKGTYKLHVADPTAGQIVTFIDDARGGQRRSIIAVRLKVATTGASPRSRRWSRTARAAPRTSRRCGQPRAAFARPTPPAERMSRAELVRVANMYFSGMQLNDGKGKYPFADDCDRIENGGRRPTRPAATGRPRPDPKTATNYSGMWTCREQFESGLLHFVSRIRDRRYVAVDEERGLVVAFVFFDHDAGASRTFKTPERPHGDGRARRRRGRGTSPSCSRWRRACCTRSRPCSSARPTA